MRMLSLQLHLRQLSGCSNSICLIKKPSLLGELGCSVYSYWTNANTVVWKQSEGGTGVCERWQGRSSKDSLSHPAVLLFRASYGALKSRCGLCCFRTLQVYVPIRQFFYNLIHPDYSAVTDVYVLMFLADTVDFIIIVFGFWAFGVCHRGICL